MWIVFFDLSAVLYFLTFQFQLTCPHMNMHLKNIDVCMNLRFFKKSNVIITNVWTNLVSWPCWLLVSWYEYACIVYVWFRWFELVCLCLVQLVSVGLFMFNWPPFCSYPSHVCIWPSHSFTSILHLFCFVLSTSWCALVGMVAWFPWHLALVWVGLGSTTESA